MRYVQWPVCHAEEPAAPSGNAFASFAANNSKSSFGSLAADTAKASSTSSSGNGTSLGVLLLAHVPISAPTSGYQVVRPVLGLSLPAPHSAIWLPVCLKTHSRISQICMEDLLLVMRAPGCMCGCLAWCPHLVPCQRFQPGGISVSLCPPLRATAR